MTQVQIHHEGNSFPSSPCLAEQFVPLRLVWSRSVRGFEMCWSQGGARGAKSAAAKSPVCSCWLHDRVDREQCVFMLGGEGRWWPHLGVQVSLAGKTTSEME